MSKSPSVQQFRLLIWKNYTLKRRRPIATLLEIFIPLGIIVILILVRNLELKFNMDQCYLREKQMDSMGPIPFVRDFLCTFNSTCYNKTQINWNNTDKNQLQIFLNNITSVYDSIPKDNFSITTLLFWFHNNTDEVQRLNYSLIYFINISTPLLRDIEMIQSKNSSIVKKGIEGLSSYVCGYEENDIIVFIDSLNIYNNSRVKRETKPCRSKFHKLVGSELYEIIAPVLFGKIFYTPDSNFTRQIIMQANNSFAILDKLRLTSIEWRLHFKDWLENELTDSPEVIELKAWLTLCEYTQKPQTAHQCTIIKQFLKNIKLVISRLSSLFSIVEYVLNCVELDKFVPTKTAEEIANLKPENMINVFAGLVFDPSLQYDNQLNSTFLNYTIRIPTNRIDSTKKYKVLDRYWTPGPRISTLIDMRYYTSGFLLLQESVDRAFVGLVTGNKEAADSIGSSMQIMPTPCYVDDRFIKFAANLMPFLLVMAWSLTFSMLVKSIVYEKERRLKEFMLVMGLSPLCHWLAWFTIAIATTIVPIVLTSLLLKYQGILEFSSPGVIFILMLSYSVSLISQAFMLSVFFNKANAASVAAGLLYFVFYIPFVVLINVQDDVTFSVYFATGLLSQVSFCNAINFIAFWEQAKEGVQFGNLFQSTVLNLNFGVGHCIVLLWLNAAIYLLITWYVEAVFPGQYGIPRRFYFFATKHYWFPDSKKPSPCYDSVYFETNNNESDEFEKVPDNLNIGISIKNLTKRFSDTDKAAVDNLNLDFYKSQITAFLGHNGAGKTTTISMLTGIFPPTSGTAFILDNDIRTDISSIRKVIGLCPQHNILFDNLTVADHVYFYGLLKGMNPDQIKSELQTIVNDVGLTKKINVQSKNLSGGMKRKLSVAMAFIGDSKAIFLDEPTAGVDPFARRGIWDLLIKYRGPDKTIVLTTHHMDEADYLSDRIAIISQGKLKCCGSAVFLKKQYGEGYYLILVKNATAQKEDFREYDRSTSGRNIHLFIKKHIDNAKFVEETRTQWTVILPLDGLRNSGFSNLFQNLDSSLDSLNVSSYGLSDTSLEEVFLRVADDPSKSESATEKSNEQLLVTVPSENDLRRSTSRLSVKNQLDINSISTIEDDDSFDTVDAKLLSGLPLLYQQILALNIKRFHYTKRNIKGIFSELILPILMILFMVFLLKMIKPFDNQPAMVIHPWLMMPKARGTDLNTFYREETIDNDRIRDITKAYRSDLGESGVRCMNRSVFSLPDLRCYSTSGNEWSKSPAGVIPLNSPSCDCNETGYQKCSNPMSGGPVSSHRYMASSDILHNLTGYNISDHLMKKFAKYTQRQYGGFQFLLANNFGLTCKLIGNGPFWDLLRLAVNRSSPQNQSNALSLDFVNYFQEFFQNSGLRTNFTRIWVNTKGYVSMPAYANIFSNLLLRSLVNSSENREKNNYGISVRTFPFKYSKEDLMGMITRQMFTEVSLSNFVILALSLVPASFVLFLIDERVSGSKRQQFVSGVNPYVYWASNFIWDIVKYAISTLLIVVVFVAFNYQSYIGSKNIAAFLTILCCYGLAIIPHMYPFSFIIRTPSTAFVVLSAYNMFVGSITTITTFFLDQLQVDEPNLRPLNDALKRLFLVFPQYSLGRGMMDLSFNYMKNNISNGKFDYRPFDWDIIGNKLASFCILFVFWSAVIVVIESGLIHRHLLGRLKNYKLKKKEMVFEEDGDVALERERVKTDTNDEDVLKVIDLTKIYNPTLKCSCKCCRKNLSRDSDLDKRLLAVNNICFGVKPGECFGLLGVNGAGKTTTFKMLTGEELITNGDAMINGQSIINNMVSAHKSMGFCPQFDALHSLLTCEEELYFYCRIRGIESGSIKSTVDSSLKSLSLSPHARKTTQTLSGGNKRKLSTAISLIGSPNVVFMDEPTSGMDAGARRFLWTKIQKLTNERRAVILTSHNMEECEVLCHRLAIMVNGEFQCLGSVQQLKSKYGDDYYITLRMHSNCDNNGEREMIKGIMGKEFPIGVFLKDENFITLQYRIDPSTYKLHRIFDFFENLKTTGIILDYSVCQTTLDEIFINFAKREDFSKILSASNIKNVSRISKKSYINHSFEDADSSEAFA